MENEHPRVQKAIALITSVPLTPPEHHLLAHFIRDSVNPGATADYVMSRASRGGDNNKAVEFEMRHLSSDWKTIVERCWFPLLALSLQILCLTTRSGNLLYHGAVEIMVGYLFGWTRTRPVQLVPHELVDGVDIVATGPLREMLAIFIGDEHLEKLKKALNVDQDCSGQLLNICTLENAAAAALEAGHIIIQPCWNAPEEAEDNLGLTREFEVKATLPGTFPVLKTNGANFVRPGDGIFLSTSDPKALPLPSTFLFQIRARFSDSLGWLGVEAQVWSPRYESGIWTEVQKFSRCIFHLIFPYFRRIWLRFPQSLRVSTYQLLLKIGHKLYGRQLNWVQRVPFGLYIKHGSSYLNLVPAGEAPALQLVEQFTDVPAPKLLDNIVHDNHNYLVMTRLPGITLLEGIPFMSYAQRSQLAKDIRACIEQFRKIRNSNETAICNANGGPIFDHRLRHPKVAGPFDSEADFNKHIIKQDRSRSHAHDIYFSHADLNTSNVLVENGVLSGIVDFGCVGFYPEYWEYTKAHFTHFGPDTSWIDILTEAFGGAYSEELEAERRLWAAP